VSVPALLPSETVASCLPTSVEPSETPAMPPTLAESDTPRPSLISASSVIDEFAVSKKGAAVERLMPNRPATSPSSLTKMLPVPLTEKGVPSPSESASSDTLSSTPV